MNADKFVDIFTDLLPYRGQRGRFRGDVERFGRCIVPRPGQPPWRHLCLANLRSLDNGGRFVTRTVMIAVPVAVLPRDLHPGDCVEFVATVLADEETGFGCNNVTALRRVVTQHARRRARHARLLAKIATAASATGMSSEET